MPFHPPRPRTYVRAAKGRSSAGGPAATGRPGLVTRTHRAGARRRKVVGERLGTRPWTGAGDGHARSAAGRAADASPAGVEVREGASLWTLRARAAVGVLQPAWRGRSVVVPIMLRGVLPRTRRPPPAPIEDREACPTASDAWHVLEYLLRHPCVDCGERDPVVLEFDHIEEKSAHVSDLISHCASKTAIDAEIARCEVVCTNCHRRRTAHRAGWRRAAIDESPVRPHLNRHVARNFAHLLAISRRSACVDCGVSDPLILEFDHVGRKRAAVTRLAWHGCSIATIDTEIRECEIRCASCQRRRTAMKGGHFRFRVLSSTSPP